MAWRAVVRSSVGTRHQKQQQPCQDYGKYCILNHKDVVVGAVADGAGSAKHADVGADLACTLLVFVATPHWLAAMQIGDGFMVVGLQGKEHQLLFQPDKGEFVNQTTFVTSAHALDEMQVNVVSGSQKFICASTDGLERVAIRMNDWTPFPPFFQPLEEYLWETPEPEQDDQYIQNFLTSERLNARTDDDKTLLLCLYENR